MTIMKTERFQNLNVKQAEEIFDVAAQLTDLAETAVTTGMTGNSHFTTPPADLTVLKTDTDTLNSSSMARL